MSYYDKFKQLTYYNVMSKIKDEEIFSWLFNVHPGVQIKFKNPYRNDKSSGCFYKRNTSGNWEFIDNSWVPNKFAFSALECVKIAYNLSDMYSALVLVNTRFKLNCGSDLPIIIRNDHTTDEPYQKESIKKHYLYEFKEFSRLDLEFWEQFNITKDILDYYNVRPVFTFKSNTGLSLTYNNNNPMYMYEFLDNTFKLYRPYSKLKWISSEPIHPEGYLQLPEKADYLIITSSLKDVMTLNSIGYWAIANSSENANTVKDYIPELKQRFKNIFVMLNNDVTGISSSKKDYYDEFKKIFSNYKDPSDQVKYGGVDSLLTILSENIYAC